MLFLTAILAWAYFKRIKNWRSNVERYEVRIKEGEYVRVNNPTSRAMEDSSVVEDVGGMNWKTLYREDISSIVYYEGKQVVVVGKDQRIIIPLSKRLEAFDELLVAVATLGIIERKSGSNWKVQRFFFNSAPAFVLLAAILIDNSWVKVIAGVLATAGYGFQVFAMLRYTKKSERKVSQMIFRVIAILLSVSIVLRVIM